MAGEAEIELQPGCKPPSLSLIVTLISSPAGAIRRHDADILLLLDGFRVSPGG
jgi:hypothetical protein